MNVKKVVILLLLAFLVFYVVSWPTEASGLVRSAISGLGDVAESLGSFVRDLV